MPVPSPVEDLTSLVICELRDDASSAYTETACNRPWGASWFLLKSAVLSPSTTSLTSRASPPSSSESASFATMARSHEDADPAAQPEASPRSRATHEIDLPPRTSTRTPTSFDSPSDWESSTAKRQRPACSGGSLRSGIARRKAASMSFRPNGELCIGECFRSQSAAAVRGAIERRSQAVTAYATAELAGTPQVTSVEDVTLPIKVHLENSTGVLGSNCYIGSSSSPIKLHLVTGKSGSLTGKEPKYVFDPVTEIVKGSGGTFVDGTFTAPSANGCVLTLFGFIPISINGVINATSGLPAGSGINNTVQNYSIEIVEAALVYP
jgi:hypothetical protein